MATIKRNDDRVILKDGRVACSCCGCCFYAAFAYEQGLYTFEDLPDEVIMFHNDTQDGQLAGPITVLKGATPIFDPEYGPFFYGNAPNPPGTGTLAPRIIYAIDEWIVGVNQIDPGLGSCLILDKFTITPTPATPTRGSIWIFDNFADAYSISGPISGTVTRTDLCTWRGDGLILRYDGRINQIGNEFIPVGTFKWRVNGNNKSGFQNTPVGSYAGGYSVS